MTLSLQGRLQTVSLLMTASIKFRCSNCHRLVPIDRAEFGSHRYENGIWRSDIEEALDAKMELDGWERGNCPSCVEYIPNLAKLDHEDEQADEDRGGE